MELDQPYSQKARQQYTEKALDWNLQDKIPRGSWRRVREKDVERHVQRSRSWPRIKKSGKSL